MVGKKKGCDVFFGIVEANEFRSMPRKTTFLFDRCILFGMPYKISSLSLPFSSVAKISDSLSRFRDKDAWAQMETEGDVLVVMI